MNRKMTDKVQNTFDRHHVQVTATEIQVYWMKDPRGVCWVPNGGGPLYGEHAKDTARWLAKHIEEFRSLLPKAIRTFPIVLGELDTRTFPGVFYRAA